MIAQSKSADRYKRPGARSSPTQRSSAIVAACLLVYACSTSPASSPPPKETTRPVQPEFVGKVWIATDASAAPGTLRIFLPDGTLVMDSCGETYRLARWQAIDGRRIEWQEDSARIEAEVTLVGSDQFQLRLHLRRELREESYRLARVPFVCPDARPLQP